MSNSIRFHETWKAHRKGVRELRAAYEAQLRAISPYEGSAGYEEDKAKAKEAFAAGLAGIREKSQAEFSKILNSLEGHVEPESMTPPTAEQLQLLQMLDMRDSLDSEELERAAKTLGSNDAAIKTLGDIAMRKGSILPQGVKTREQQRRAILDELRRAVASLMAWDGRSGSQVMGDYLAAKHAARYGGAMPEDGSSASHLAADMEAGTGAADTLGAILPRFDYGTVSAFMNEG